MISSSLLERHGRHLYSFLHNLRFEDQRSLLPGVSLLIPYLSSGWGQLLDRGRGKDTVGPQRSVGAYEVRVLLPPELTPMQAGGACGFVTMVIGWYLLLALMLSTVDFPINLPVGDLSTVFKGGADLRKSRIDKVREDVEKQA